jgi:hypothetical protein
VASAPPSASSPARATDGSVEPITRFVAGVNENRPEVATAAFSADGVVVDLGREFWGLAQIRTWVDELIRYDGTFVLDAPTQAGGRVSWAHQFTSTVYSSRDRGFADVSGGRITRLEIHHGRR